MTRSIDLCLSVPRRLGTRDCTALHCVFGYCPARARSLPEFPHYFLNAPKLNAPLIPFLITASCQRRTTTTTTTKTTPTTTAEDEEEHTLPSSSLALLRTSPYSSTKPNYPNELLLSLSLSLSCRLFSMPSFFFFFFFFAL